MVKKETVHYGLSTLKKWKIKINNNQTWFVADILFEKDVDVELSPIFDVEQIKLVDSIWLSRSILVPSLLDNIWLVEQFVKIWFVELILSMLWFVGLILSRFSMGAHFGGM